MLEGVVARDGGGVEKSTVARGPNSYLLARHVVRERA